MATAIFSVSPDWAIADERDRLLYVDLFDMRFFRKTTLGYTIVAGRVTASTLPGGLKSRKCLYLGNSGKGIKGWKRVGKDDDIAGPDVFVIGGAKTICSLSPIIDRYLVSHFKMPPIHVPSVFMEEVTVSLLGSCNRRVVEEYPNFTIVEYLRPKSAA